MMTNSEIIAVVQAFEAGKKIERCDMPWRAPQQWVYDPEPEWNFPYSDYRVVVPLATTAAAGAEWGTSITAANPLLQALFTSRRE